MDEHVERALMKPMRLFIAIEFPSPVRDHLVGVQETLRPRLGRSTIIAPDNLHLTLKFLGEVDGARNAALQESLAKVKASGPIHLFPSGLECFPLRGPVRIVAVALAGEVEKLLGIQHAIEQRCKFLGFEQERREYRPHVTIARARPTLPPGFRDAATEASTSLWPGPAFEAAEFVLVKSDLRPQGSQYTPIARFPLTSA